MGGERKKRVLADPVDIKDLQIRGNEQLSVDHPLLIVDDLDRAAVRSNGDERGSWFGKGFERMKDSNTTGKETEGLEHSSHAEAVEERSFHGAERRVSKGHGVVLDHGKC